MIQCKCGHRAPAAKRYTCHCGALWDKDEGWIAIGRSTECIHLGPATGNVVSCSTCSGGDQQIRRCEIHGVTVQRKPVVRAGNQRWDGMTCSECRAKELGYEDTRN